MLWIVMLLVKINRGYGNGVSNDVSINRSSSNKQVIYLSQNIEIATIDNLKMHLTHQNNHIYDQHQIIQQKHHSNKQKSQLRFSQQYSYQHIPEWQKNQQHNHNNNNNNNNAKNKSVLQLNTKIVNMKLIVTKPSNLNQTQLMSLKLSKKQSLPLSLQCSILSQQLSKLKQKLNTYVQILQQKFISFNNINSIVIGNQQQQKQYEKIQKIQKIQKNNNRMIEQTPINKLKQNKQNKYSQKIDKQFGNELEILQKSRWKQEKQQYIEYIKNLQKQLNEYKLKLSKYQSISSPIQVNNRLKHFTDDSLVQSSIFKSPNLFSQIKKPMNNNILNNKYNIFKSSIQENKFLYVNNNISNHDKSIDNQSKRSKSKGGKVIYLGR